MKSDLMKYNIILSPMITEKSTNLSALNKVTFKVSKDASKKIDKK
jgi:large subunit ribosomal protein L23